jgi:hypothetical protein
MKKPVQSSKMFFQHLTVILLEASCRESEKFGDDYFFISDEKLKCYANPSADISSTDDRVTRLGKFSPIGQLFTFAQGSFSQVTEVAHTLGYFFLWKK